MAELLLELLSEEIPARMQARAAEDLKRLVTDKLKEEGLSFDRAEAYATPRRLALVVDGLPEKQPDRTEKRKGPRVGAPENAIQGFLKSAGLESVDQCEVREVKGAAFYFVVSERKGGSIEGPLLDILVSAIWSLPWPKSMRWPDEQSGYVRPLRNVLLMFNGKPVNLMEGFRTDRGSSIPVIDKTVGHRFLAPGPFEVKDFADYKKKLRDAFVVLDAAERKRIIRDEAAKLAKQAGLAVRDDPALLDEVVGLVEWPKVLMGAIDPAFMELPAEVLTAAMRTHQKYFALEDKTGKLAPRFLVVANIEAADRGKAIVAGNERVLRARLADARFFWDQDRKRTLESRVPALNGVVFHAKLGSLGDKVDRVEALAVGLAKHVPGAEAGPVRSAARLAKADLVTEMVGEFPELQGVMGRYYALADGERAEVAEAVAEHYAPQGPGDRCPAAPVSVAVALADKIDTLVGFFAIGETPTGSRDPYALRRAALGIIRLVLENGLRLPLDQAFRRAIGSFAPATKLSEDRIAGVSAELLAFFAERLKVHLREQGVRHDLITAIFAIGGEDDLVRLLERVDRLRDFVETDDGANLLVAYRRAANIVRIEEKKDKTEYGDEVDAKRLAEERERALYAALAAAAEEAEAARDKEDFTAAMAALSKLRRPIDLFFDEVTVNVDEKPLRENRLRLLSRIRGTMDRVADFSKIEG